MRKLFFASLVVLAVCVFTFGQTQQNPCPNVEITTPAEGYSGRGGKYAITANVSIENSESLQYEWKISHNVPLDENGKAVIYFTAIDDIDRVELTATVQIKGLPKNCQNVFTKSFVMTFSVGTPRILDDYEAMAFSKEKARLDAIVAELKKLDDVIAYFTIYPKYKETQQNLDNRASQIKDYLLSKHKISEEKFVVVLGNSTDKPHTRVYIAPARK